MLTMRVNVAVTLLSVLVVAVSCQEHEEEVRFDMRHLLVWPPPEGVTLKSTIRRDWVGLFAGDIKLAVKYPMDGDWRLKVTFRRSIFDMDVCQDDMVLEEISDDKKEFTFRKPKWARNMLSPHQTLHASFVGDVWEKVKGLQGDIEFIPPESSCSITCGSSSLIVTELPKVAQITVPVATFGFAKYDPVIRFKSSVPLYYIAVLRASLGLLQGLDYGYVTTTDGGYSHSVPVDISSIRNWRSGNINLIVRYEYDTTILQNSIFPGVIFYPHMSSEEECSCADIDIWTTDIVDRFNVVLGNDEEE